MPRLYRDSPLNSIWEGSGNVAALDVLRALVKEPEGLPAFLAECELAAGANARFDDHLRAPRQRSPSLANGGEPQYLARRVVEDLAVALQAIAAAAQRARPRSRTPSAPRAWAAMAAAPTGRCPPGSTRSRSWTARCPPDEDPHLRGRRAGRRASRSTGRARQRHHARDAARAGRVRRAGQPRPARARDRAGRRTARGSAAATTWSSRRRGRPGSAHPARWLAARARDDRANHDPSGTWDPVVDYADDEPQRARLHVAVPRRQAGRLQGPRLLRGGRHRHGALLATCS